MSSSTPNTSQRSSISFSSSSHERRLLYGDLMVEVQTFSEETNVDNVERVKKLHNIIDKVASEAPNENNNDVLNTEDCYMHSKVLKDTSEATSRCTELITDEVNKYDKFELINHIVDNPEYWNFTFPNEVPVFSYLNGTFEPTPPEARPRAPRRRVERQQAQALKAPQKISQIEKKDELSEIIQQLHRFIIKACQSGAISYFHLVLDPKCFTRTIENIYYLSFLVKDGWVAVSLDERTGLPFVRPIREQKRQRTEGVEGNQFVVSMDMERWRELIQAFDIRKPMMKLK